VIKVPVPGVTFKVLALFLVFSGVGVRTSVAADESKKISVGLYLAENTTPDKDAKVAIGTLHHCLRTVFGYANYELLQSQDVALAETGDHWFVPRKDFFMNIKPLNRTPADQSFDYEIYQNGFIVASGRYEIHHEMPLYIKGPDLNENRLIFVVESKW
jgi:hypothetical protein